MPVPTGVQGLDCTQDRKLLVVRNSPPEVQVLWDLQAFVLMGLRKQVFPIHKNELQVQHTKYLYHQQVTHGKSYLQQEESCLLTCDWRSAATPRSPNSKPVSQDTSCHSTPSQAAQSLAAPSVESQACSAVHPGGSLQVRLSHTPACTGFCSAYQQMPLCRHAYLQARWR